MSIRVVARIRPLLKSEHEKDAIVKIAKPANTSSDVSYTGSNTGPLTLKIPNPKNASEIYSFQFNGIYDQVASQQDLFDAESMFLCHGCASCYNPLCSSFSADNLVIVSRANDEASLLRLRRHNFRIWLYRHGQDAYDARREVFSRSGHDSETAQQYLSKKSQN